MKSGVEQILGRLLLFANIAAAIVACLVALLVWAAPEAMSTVSNREPGVFRIAVRDASGLGLVAFAAAVLLVGDVLWLAWGLAPRGPQAAVVSVTDAGPVRVSREALETGLRAAGEGIPDLARLRVHVDTRSRGRLIVVQAQFQAKDGASLERVSADLRRVLTDRFRQLVQLPAHARLELALEFGGFVGRGAKAAEATPPPEPESQPFTGPRYPIDEDG